MSDMLSYRPEDLAPRQAARLLNSLVIPRPIAWVSTVGLDGTPNLAPFSYFNVVSSKPPVVMFSVSGGHGQEKDTLRNIRETGEFVVNLVPDYLAEAMNLTSGRYAYGVNEFELAELAAIPSVTIRPPRVAKSPVALEVRVQQLVPVAGSQSVIVVGDVLHYHIHPDVLADDGLVDAGQLRPLARLGRDQYTTLGELMSITRPD